MASLEFVVGVAFVGLLVGVAVGRTENVYCPSTCSCLGHLVDCSRRGLIEIPDDLPVWVEILELQNNDITSVPDDVFKELANLQQLDLSHNQLRSVNATAFQHLPNLRELKIQNNHLREIPDLGHLPNLTLLSLHHNEIHSVSLTALTGLTNLRTLDLNHNRIVDLAVGSFPNNTRLLHLYLNNNRIINIEQCSLDNLTHLETLRLNKNRLSTFPKELFRKLRSLKTLELNRNQLVQVEGLSFHGLESLQVLRLQNNAIRLLLDGAFWGLSSIQQLKLDHNNITVVTKGWLYGLASLQQLSLRHNRINEIEDDGWEFCHQLWELELPNNRLQAIRRGTFAKLGKLQHLNLNHNRISYVEDSAFRGLHSLETLELNNNEISWAIEDMNGAFVGLDRLTKLGLESNTITSIAKRAFLGLDSLKHLELGDNAITNIQQNAFQGMKDLQQLRFNSSNFLCDCELQWLSEWLLQSGFQTSVTARCAHPEWLKGKSIFDISPEDFTCNDFPKPYLNEEPETQITLKGANVTLVCRAASSSDSPMIFVWKKDNMNIKNARVEKFANTSDGSIVEYTSVLMLWNITDKDEGRYQCVVTNRFGSTYSQKAKITVHVYPLFVKTPADVTVKAGSTARLECAARGQPQPVIAWQKDGGDDFPAARERRMHVMPTDDVFFIVNVKSSDMGMYSCTAQNAAGLIMANATLVVLETPSFVKAIEDKKTEVGETTVLECMATGSPKPKLTWMKDGEPLILTERHFFTADNQLLIIMQTQHSDGGMYTCEMSNTLGTERGTAQLKVLLAHPVTMEDESMTTGIIIIAVVCCVVLTSLVWVIIIYQTRKRSEEFSPTNSDETTLPEELTPYPSFPTACTSAFQGSAAHLYIDNHSEHSSKDSGTGDSTERSQDALLPHQQHPPIAPMETKGLHVIVRGPSAASLQGPASDSSLDTLTSTPSTRTTSSGDAFPARPTNHERLIPVVLARAALHPAPNAAEVTRWSAGRSHSVDLPSESSPAPRGNQLDISRNLGYATFPRNVSPSQNSWNTGSLRHLRLPREVQNDSGSFSIESEDARSFQPLLVPSSRMQRHSVTSLPDPYNLPLTGIPQQSPLPLPSQRFHAAVTQPRC